MFCAPGMFDKVELYYVVTSIPQGWRYDFCLEKLCHGFIVGEDNDRFRRPLENMPKFFECEVYRKKVLFADGLVYLGWGEDCGTIDNRCI